MEGVNETLIENLKRLGKYEHFATLVPMSREELKLRGFKNIRHRGVLQLHYVDGLGYPEMLLNQEHQKFGMSLVWPEYMIHNLSIKYINNKMRNMKCVQ